MPIVRNTESKVAGVQRHLMETWKQEFPVFHQQQKRLLKFLPWTAEGTSRPLRKATYPWKESVPMPKPWPYGKGRTYQTFRDRKLDMTIYPFDLTVMWSGWDETDDIPGDLRSHVEMGVKRFFMLPDQMIAEYFNGTASLNPSLHNAYDGATMFSATDGDGAARMSVTGGNIVSAPSPTPAGIHTTLGYCQQRWLNAKDPAGQPIFTPSDVQYKNMFVIHPVALTQAMQRASSQEFLHLENQSLGPASNWLKGTFQHEANPYLSDQSDYYVVLDHPYWKAFVWKAPGTNSAGESSGEIAQSDLRTIIADFNNSDNARQYNEIAQHCDIRAGLAPWFVMMTIKANVT